ncbi:hypothetical protein DSO57_1026601 [Entomophthora muscae]|uniref:Uncharacterized protein n=1 Tax=Entomophthora muscae TaxID=34485 RepID=A0ACC2TP15_9FUNG|nr:hypothetical protein DSO57_1026601 [Entomophthora muscae]
MIDSGLENITATIGWQNSSPNDAHQKESLVNRWFKYPSGHWGQKFHCGRHSTPPPTKSLLVQPHASFYLLLYLIGYYLLGCFSSLMGRFAYLGHLGHRVMVTVPIGSAIAGLNLGALAHQIGGLFPSKWVPERDIEIECCHFYSTASANPELAACEPSSKCQSPIGIMHSDLKSAKFRDAKIESIRTLIC